jgi:GTPase SAR1 family protein
MRIAIIGAQGTGKTTLVESFLKRNPKYTRPEKTYRDLLKDKGITINEGGTQGSQKHILDALVDQAIMNAENKYCIHDRCVLDNLVYSLYLHDRDPKAVTGEFISNSIDIVRTTLPFYDVLFYLPVDERSPVNLAEEKETRASSEQYRLEIDNLFRAIHASYQDRDGRIFPLEDSPALIEIWGDEEKQQKTDMIADYVDPESGDLVETETSIIQTLSDLAMQDDLLRQVGYKPKY